MVAFHNLIHRLLYIPLSEVIYSRELKTIKIIAMNNGYSAVLNKKNQKENLATFPFATLSVNRLTVFPQHVHLKNL